MKRLKLLTIVGARPQFVKASVLSRQISIDDTFIEILLHTGQHYDVEMSKLFFDQLNIPEPYLNLNIGSGLHGVQTAKMIGGIEAQIIKHRPDWVILYGDTNSTLAGAIAASKVKFVKTAHIEAGLRSYNRNMPEEINRIATDHISDVLFAPTLTAKEILRKEGLEERTVLSGDIMLDSTLHNLKLAERKVRSNYIADFKKPYYLATVHRQENTDDENRLNSIFNAFAHLDKKVVLPIHPRTRLKLKQLTLSENLHIIDPVGPLEMLILLKNCSKVFTDSGGLQKEAFFLKKPCVTLRDETEWTETLKGRWNQLAGSEYHRILTAATMAPYTEQEDYFGDGKAAICILETLKSYGE